MKLEKGQRYKATISLSGFDAMASNGMLRDKLVEVGFKDVIVEGSRKVRTATGIWPGETMEVDLPKQVTKCNVV
jgi:hypothetical protein